MNNLRPPHGTLVLAVALALTGGARPARAMGPHGAGYSTALPDSARLTRAAVLARVAAATNDHPADFSGANLSSLDLSGQDFHFAKFVGANLDSVNLSHANLQAANFNHATARGADFTDAVLDLATMVDADFAGAKLPGATLFAVVITGVNLTDADLTGVRLITSAAGAKFIRAKMMHANLGADPNNQPMGVMRADLTNADLTGADLTDASLRKARLTRANFTDATLTGVDFSLAELSGTVFHDIKGRETIKGLSTAKYVGDAQFDPQ
jgi:uncharacterized protein YjbI with pentapeptide repeats